MLDKSIKQGKEKRKQYRGSKAVSHSCRNHKSCNRCKSDRTYANDKRLQSADDKIEVVGE